MDSIEIVAAIYAKNVRNEGRIAFNNGAKIEDNPYPIKFYISNYNHWRIGYVLAREHALHENFRSYVNTREWLANEEMSEKRRAFWSKYLAFKTKNSPEILTMYEEYRNLLDDK